MKFTRSIASTIAVCVLLAFGAIAQQAVPVAVSSRGSNLSFVAGRFVANEYSSYGGAFASEIYQGNASTGSSTITVRGGYIVLQDGRAVVPFAVGVPIVINDSTPELVTPTAVSGCYNSKGMNQDAILVTCTITASFTYTHGIGASISSGTGGLAEAILDAFNWGGGVVVIEPGFLLNTTCTNCYASTNAMIAALVPYQSVSIEDDRFGAPQYWNVGQAAAALLPAPTTLTSSTVGFGINGANTTGGAYTGTSTYYYCIAYVDVGGQEGPCSASFSGATAGTGSTNQIGFAAPAASTGAVGYTAYISVASGSYALSYSVPLTSANCTLTKIEVVTPACAVTNATYGQTGSNLVVAALTVNTAPLPTLLGGANNQYTGNSNGRTTYAYTPSTRLAAQGIPSVSLPFTATAGTISSTDPVVLGTVNLPPGFMNYAGKTIRVCGRYKGTPSSSTTIENIQVWWDAPGSDTAGTPVELANIQGTASYTAVVYNGSFCENFTTTIAGAGATAGSVQGGADFASDGIASAPTNLVTQLDTLNAAVGSLDLAGPTGYPTHLDIVQNHTTGSDGAFQLLNLTVEIL